MGTPQLKLAGADTVDSQSQPRSPERLALAEALNKRAEAQERLDAIKRAQDTAANHARTARDAVEAAEASVEVAKTQAARHLVDNALGKGGEAPMTVQAARAAVTEAKDNLDAALSAQAELGNQLRAAETKLLLAGNGVTRAYQAALAADPSVDKLLAERAALNDRLRDVERALHCIWRAGGLHQFQSWTITPAELSNNDPKGELVEQWQVALASLGDNADVVLPV